MTDDLSADDPTELGDDDLIDSPIADAPPRRATSKKGSASRKRQAPVREPDDLDEADVSRERLQKVLAAAGLASRRHCEEYILDGRVTVDGKVVTTLGIKVDPTAQKVCVDGERVKVERRQYFLVNKPPCIVSTNADPNGRPRVIDLLPPWKGRLFTVGRLDEGSEGLLLVTNDGDLAHRLAHPKFQVERVYRALCAGTPTDDVLRQLRQGLYFTEGKFRVRDVRRIKTNGRATVLELVLTEGQNREIRRLLARVGHKVMKLKRIAFGPLRLGELATAAYRPLTPVELKVLKDFSTIDPARRQHMRRPAGGRTPASGRAPSGRPFRQTARKTGRPAKGPKASKRSRRGR
jgi:23S rRNA pseudouridine2605 synthase